jgi:hypothetical protein
MSRGVPDTDVDQVVFAQLAFDNEIEHCEVADPAIRLSAVGSERISATHEGLQFAVAPSGFALAFNGPPTEMSGSSLQH